MSRNPERVDLILGEIRRIWTDHPDLRLTQLLHNALVPEPFSYFTEDDALLSGLLNYPKEGN